MPQDPKLKEAEQKLEDAITEYLSARGRHEGVLIEWVLVTAQAGVDEQGEFTSTGISVPYAQRNYATAGLLQYAQVRMNMAMAEQRGTR